MKSEGKSYFSSFFLSSININSRVSPMLTSERAKEPQPRLRLHYLDGLRGLVSLYVVVFHINRYMGEQVPVFLQLLGKTLRYGNFAVGVFIVLSGYVLMLPIARSQGSYLSKGLWNYIQRRSQRILPPYYAALVLSLVCAVIVLALIRFFNFQWHESPNYGEFHPVFSAVDVLTHFLLIHNLSPNTLFSINAPLWSVAVEWQIYFIFPLLLLPIRRRFGLFSAVFTAFLISLAAFYLSNRFFGPTHPWFLGLFALGMAAADIGFSQKPNLILMRESLPWGILAIIFFVSGFITEWETLQLDRWINESFWGLGVACLLIYCTKFVVEGKESPLILRFFETPWAILLGAFSYSLYLTHGVVVTVIGNLFINLHLPQIEFITIFYVVAIPLSLLIAYLFYLIFEKPFISKFFKKA